MKEVTKNTLLRIMSAVVALPIYVLAIVTDKLQSIPILIVSLIISIACLVEFYYITDKKDEGGAFFKTGITVGVLINIIMYLFANSSIYGYSKYIKSFDAKVIFLILVIFISALFFLQLFKNKIKGSSYSI